MTTPLLTRHRWSPRGEDDNAVVEKVLEETYQYCNVEITLLQVKVWNAEFTSTKVLI
jgi:hypothetical protein